jgi:RHS repeat-associated protein
MNSDTTKYYYLKDHLGSTRCIINSTNTVISAQDYDVWGYTVQDRTYNSTFKYKYTGKERDSENNYDYFGARYYDSRIGRWGGVDPLFEKHIGWTPYNYTLGKPLTLVDPKGKQVEITIRTYIPQESSNNPLYHVMHDNRHADYNSSSYRTEQRFVVEPNKNISENAIKEYSSNIGTTVAYPLLKPENVQIKKGEGNLPDPTVIWAKNIKSGSDPVLIYNRENENVFPEIFKLSNEYKDINFYNVNIVK